MLQNWEERYFTSSPPSSYACPEAKVNFEGEEEEKEIFHHVSKMSLLSDF